MHTDPQAAQAVPPKQPAPLWMKFMLVAITILATLQLGKDLGGLNFATVLADSSFANVFRILGDSSSPPVPGRLTASHDTYNMCQNKLGIDYGISTSGVLMGQGDIDQHDTMMRQLYVLGMRYVQVNVNSTTSSDVTNVATIVRMAYGHHLMPVIYLENTDGGDATSRINAIVNFYRQVNETAGLGKKFVASTAPRKVVENDSGGTQWAEAAAIAQGVADQLVDTDDIILATPVLRVFQPGSGNEESDGRVESPEDPGVGWRLDEVKVFQKVGADLSKFEILLVGIKNFDDAFASAVSPYYRRGYFYYASDGPPNSFSKASQWIQSVNEEKGLNIRSIIINFGPSLDPDTSGAPNLKQRLSYDYGHFADDHSVQAVIFDKSVADNLIDEKDPPLVPPLENQCKVGINFASMASVGSGEINKAAEIGYGHGLVIINSPGEAGNATKDVNSMCEVGMVPVVRSCITGVCGFTSGGEQAETYKQIIAGASACAAKNIQPYVICGHNEPESEYSAGFRAEGAWSRQCLNAMSGSGAKIMSTVFNVTHPDKKQQAADWLSGFGGAPTGFDCIGMNTYTIYQSGGSTNGSKAIDFYNQFITDAPAFKDLPFCVTETGVGTNFGGLGEKIGFGTNPGLAAEAIRPLLEEGAKMVLGFNFIGTNPGWQMFHLTDDGRSLTRNMCNIGPRDKDAKIIDTTALVDFFGFAQTYGNNCDYDTVEVKQDFAPNSKAIACGGLNMETGGKVARTKVLCTSPTSCMGTVRYTIQVGLPIRHLGSNSVLGTQTHPYTPYTIHAFNNINLPQYDFSNQYASVLTSTSGNYQMPWLGNALFITGQIAKIQRAAVTDVTDLTIVDSPGSYANRTQLEENSAIDRGKWVWGYNSENLNVATKIPLERALCIGNVCFDKYKGVNDVLTQYDYYDPDKLAVGGRNVAQCGGKVRRADVDPQNMIYGTEEIIATDIWSGTGAELCYEEWLPDDKISGGGLSCSVVQTVYCDEYETAGQRFDALARGISPQSFFLSEANVRSGACHASGGKINTAIKYNGGADSYGSTNVKFRSDLPKLPSYDIPGAYEALANLYRIVQTRMSQNGLKIIFNEIADAGWQSDIILKAYTETPLGDHEIQTPRINNMLEDFAGSVAGAQTASCTNKFSLVGDSLASEQADSLSLSGTYRLTLPGASTETLLAQPQSEWDRILNNDSEYVVVMIGTNDCGGLPGGIAKFKQNLTAIVNKLKSKKVIVSKILDGLAYCVEGGVANWNAAIAEVAGATGSTIRDVSGVEVRDEGLGVNNRHAASYDLINSRTFELVGCEGSTTINPDTSGGPQLPPGGPSATDLKNYKEYNHYLAEGANVHIAHQYYEALGLIDHLSRYLSVLLENTGLPSGKLVNDENGNILYDSGSADLFAGIAGCDDLYTRTLEQAIGRKINCIVPYSPKETDTYMQDPLAAFLCSKGYGIIGECTALQCIPESPATKKTGTLTCEIDMRDTSDDVEWAKVSDFISHYYIEQYNLDKNQSQTWIGDPDVNEGLYKLADGTGRTLEQALIDNLGQAGFERERNDRIRVTSEVVNYAKSLNLNPKFILTLWLEETGASAVGKRNMGCLYFRDGTATVPVDPDPDRLPDGTNSTGYVDYLINKLKEQVDCVNTYVQYADGDPGDTSKFNQFMCTYSGEVGRPDCNAFESNPNFPVNVCGIYAKLGGNSSNPQPAANASTSQLQMCNNISGTNGCNTVLDGIKLGWPLDNLPQVRVTQPYGNTPDGRSGPHNGIDYGVPIGTKLYAAAPGVVVNLYNSSDNYARRGRVCAAGDTCYPSNRITIEHTTTSGKKFWTTYVHVSPNTLVTVGQHVNLGQQIGTTGDNGDSSGPHLHFELRHKNCYDGYGSATLGTCSMDPAPYLGADTALQCTDPDATDPEACLDPSSTEYLLFPVGRDRKIPCCTEPTNTVKVDTDLKTYNGSFSLIPGAKQALETMMSAMQQDDPDAYASCAFNWGYRSAAVQDSFGSCGSNDTACACHSEHQLGTTVDFAPSFIADVGQFKGTACYDWLNRNAADYGYVQSYTDGNPDYVTEPWHWRWVGPEVAKQYKNQSKYLLNFLEDLQSSGQTYTF